MSSALSAEKPPISRITPWLICFSATLFFFFQMMQFAMINPLSEHLMKAFSIGGTQLSTLSASYFYGIACFYLPAGIFLDHVNLRKFIITCMSISIVLLAAFGFIHNYYLALGDRFLTGFFHGVAFLTTLRMCQQWFPEKRVGMAMALMLSLGLLGGTVAQTPLLVLSHAFGLQTSMLVFASFGLLALCFVIAVLREAPYEKTVKIERFNFTIFKTSLRQAAGNGQNWLCSLYVCFINAPMFILGVLWGSLYLTQAQHFSAEQATNIISMIYLGSIVGMPLSGWLSDRIGSRRVLMIWGGFCSLVLVTVMLYLNVSSEFVAGMFFFLIGAITSTQVLSYPVIAFSNPESIASTAMGFANIIIMGGAAVLQILFGWFMQTQWQHHVTMTGTPLFSRDAYQASLLLIPALFVLSIVVAWLVKEDNN